jgi:hypothetical protein
MGKVEKTMELVLEFEDKVGVFSKLTGALAKEGVNLLSLCAYSMENKAYCMIVTQDNAKAKAVAVQHGWKVKERPVVMVEINNKVGAAQEVADQVKAAGINLCYAYCTACGCGEDSCSTDCNCRMILCSENNNDKLAAALS